MNPCSPRCPLNETKKYLSRIILGTSLPKSGKLLPLFEVTNRKEWGLADQENRGAPTKKWVWAKKEALSFQFLPFNQA